MRWSRCASTSQEILILLLNKYKFQKNEINYNIQHRGLLSVSTSQGNKAEIMQPYCG